MNVETVWPVEKLLKKLRENLERHKTIYAEALAGYRTSLVTTLRGELAKYEADPNKADRLYVHSEPPTSHAVEYERVIRMLETTGEPNIRLNVADFKKLVEDNWDWTSNFARDTAAFSSTARVYYAINSVGINNG